MKIKSLLILGLLVVTASYFVGRDDTLPETTINQQALIESKQPTPDELWEKQQQQRAAVPDASKTTALEPEKVVIKSAIKHIDMEKPVIVKKTIPTPDEIWEQQHQVNVNSENFLPSDTAKLDVISAQQLEAEALVNTRNTINLTSEKLPDDPENLEGNGELATTVPLLEVEPIELKELELSIDNNGVNEFAAAETEFDVVPLELQELEAVAVSKEKQGYYREYQEPLFDPVTGMAEQ